ncbi:MAG: hypothetical protein GYA02_13735 [Clostridiaceae bacterium]|nr:hypothetical protein [Clostridiaceae bacterium]
MYSQFCRNLKNYIRINSHGNPDNSLRVKIAEDIIHLTNVEAYKTYKKRNDPLYKRIGEFIYILSRYKSRYPSLERFIWELWAYGFDIIETQNLRQHNIKHMDEKAKLVDLMLSTHYFA